MSSYQSPQDEGYSEDPLTSQLSVSAERDIASLLSRDELGLSSTELHRYLRCLIHSLSTPKTEEELKEHYLTLKALLDFAPTAMVHQLEQHAIHPRLYIDFHARLPAEVCLKILGYLSPVTLMATALTSPAWMSMSMDRRLWRGLYFREGWQIRQPELENLEKELARSQLQTGRARPSTDQNDGHTDKRRATSKRKVTSPTSNDDTEMPDVDHVSGSQQPSLFGRQPSSMDAIESFSSQNRGNISRPNSAVTPRQGRFPDRKYKPDTPKTSDDKPQALRVARKPLDLSFLTSLVVKDHVHNDRFLNWQYLYTQRRRLENNWEKGKFVNFQLPHPDHSYEAHRQCIYTIQYSGKYLVSGSRDRTLRIWNIETQRLVMAPLEGHVGSVLCLQFDADPSEDIIVSGSSDSTVNIWRFSTGQLLQSLTKAHRESVLNVKFDHRILVTCSKDKTIKIFTRRNLYPGDLGYPSIEEPIRSVPTVLNNYGYSHTPLADLPILRPYTEIGILEGHNAAVNAVQIYKNEVASASGDRHVKIWDWPTGTCTRTVIGHQKGIACVQYDGRRIVSGSSDNEVKVFDSNTGLEVASLRGHTNLVRTVQAGFGDLSYSAEEDLADARAVDDEYFKAVDSGAVPRTLRRGQPRNAGSRKPEDILAYGAKLPPGGGGGKYGRIVSGSYDETIIIWRRDKEGVWKAKHTLRQASAAEAASQQPQRTLEEVDIPPNPHTPGTTEHDRWIIVHAVRGGSGPLQRALNRFPHLLQHPALVERITSIRTPSIQSTLRNIVALAIHRQVSGDPDLQAPPGGFPFPAAAHVALGPTTPPSTATPSVTTHDDHYTHHTLVDLPSNTVASIGAALGSAQNAQSDQPMATFPVLSPPAPTPAHSLGQVYTDTQDEGHPHPAVGGTPPQVTHQALTQAAAPGLAASTATQHPAHVAPQTQAVAQEVQAPDQARVFKLQFDARRIICCSQTNTIVGWDFANGDKKIEEASRFFATID